MALLTPTRRHLTPWPAAGVWPGLFDVPRVPVHAAIARRLAAAAVRTLPMTLLFPDGTRWGAGGPTLELVRPDRFFARLGADGLIGFGEAWMTGDLTTGGWQVPLDGKRSGPDALDPDLINAATDELADVLEVLAHRMSVLVPRPLQTLRRMWQHRLPADEENSPTGARENIHRHYDLSNDLFSLFLDESMMYSAAWFDPARPAESLTDAQHRKIDGILDLAGVRAGSRVLEIGTGWGEAAIRAAQRGARVTTLTLSVEQAELARVRAEQAGVSDRITIDVRDYRDAVGEYDSVISIEMIEAVGERFWPEYFATVDRLLAPGGRFGLQSITMPHHRLQATKDNYTWIHKYIFPGGMLPSTDAISQVTRKHTSMHVSNIAPMGQHYAHTLRLWREQFVSRWQSVQALGFDDRFCRMWEFYLAYCEAGFRTGYLDVAQIRIER